jgi:predicted nucleotidyltransferase
MKKDIVLDGIVRVIRRVREPEKIVLFGSRASGHAGKTSDIDIAIYGKDWTDQNLNEAKHRLEEDVRTPLKFDLINFYAVNNPRLKKNIETTRKVLYESGKDQGAVR